MRWTKRGLPWSLRTGVIFAIEGAVLALEMLQMLKAWGLTASLLLGSSADASPWQLFERMREKLLTSGVLGAEFRQFWYPTGSQVSPSEEERGRLLLRLPNCVRFIYETPLDRNYLIERGRVRSWTEESWTGEVFEISEASEPLTALWFAPIQELRQKFEGRLGRTRPARLVLRPNDPSSRTQSVEIELGADLLPRQISWTDREANRTELRLEFWQPVQHTDPCQAPTGLDWRTPSGG